jgi:hypothetical protein
MSIIDPNDELLNNPETNGQKADFAKQAIASVDTGANAEHIAVDQPKPAFSLDDLEAKLAAIYTRVMNAAQYGWNEPTVKEGIKEANGMLQELLAITIKHKQDLTPIDVFYPSAPAILEEFRQETPDHYVCGVQLIEQGKLVGTSLYTTIVKARTIRDILNKRFAELRVNHEAKIINYPVY